MKPAYTLLILFCSISTPLYAARTQVSGAIAADTVWTDTVEVTGTVTVNNGIILTIHPGTRVVFQGNYKLNVQGRLQAVGTAADSIVFTTRDTTVTWHGLRWDATPATNDTSRLSYCRLERARAAGGGADNSGGAVHISNFRNVYLRHCLLINNRATDYGGGIYLGTSAGALIENTTITANQALSGGGVYCNYNSTFTMVNCVVSGNTASTGLGGGLYIRYNSHPSITNTVVTHNRAYSGGGGIYCSQANPILTNITLCNNTLSPYGAGGAGLYCSESGPVVTNTLIWDNTGGDSSQVYLADGGSDPGFIYCNIQGLQEGITGPGSGSVYNGVFDWDINRAPLLADTASGDFRLTGVSPCLNRGTPDTAGLGLAATDPAGNPRVYAGTTARVDIGAYEFPGEPYGPLAAVFYPSAERLVYAESSYTDTVYATAEPLPGFSLLAAPTGVALDESTGILTWTPGISQTGLNQITIRATNAGGADTLVKTVYVYDWNLVRLEKGTVSASQTWTQDSVKVLGDITINHSRTLTLQPGLVMQFCGYYRINVQGRLLAQGTAADSIVFIARDTTGGWHGIRWDSTAAGNDTSRFDYCRLQYGHATGSGEDRNGGALYLRLFGKVTVNHSYLGNNNAAYRGGAVYCYDGRITVTGSVFNGNRAEEGGAAHLTLSHYCAFTGCTFTGNTATYGGGINAFGSACYLTGNTFAGNHGTGSGGALYVRSNSDHWMNGNTITGNTAGSGAGLYIYQAGPSLEGDIISGNTATGNGGGVYCYQDEPEFRNVLVTGNAAGKGGALYTYSSTPLIINATISGNTAAEGGGMYCYLSGADVINTILWDNHATTNGDQVYLYGSSNPDFRYCDVQGGAAAFYGAGGSGRLYKNNLDADPYFADAAGEDYTLRDSSWCVNAGTPDTTGLGLDTLDLAGNDRLYDGAVTRIDMGAYEYQGDPARSIAPVFFLVPPDQHIYCQVPYYDSVAASGFPAPQYAIVQAPVGFGLSTVSGAIYWNPETNQTGRDTIILAAANAGGADTLSYVLTVVNPDTIRLACGAVNADTRWEADTVKVVCDVTVNSNATLTIAPGTIVEFMGHHTLGIKGRLLAVGTITDSIVFTTRDTALGWHGIRFDLTSSPDTSHLKYCRLENARSTGTGSDGDGGALLVNYFSRLMVSHCLFTGNRATYGGAIHVNNASPVIMNTGIRNNDASRGGGIYLDNQADPRLYNVLVVNNTASYGGGIGVNYNCLPLVTNCVIGNNHGSWGGGVHCESSSPVFTNSILWGNSATGGAQVYLGSSTADPDFYHCDVQGDSLAFYGNGAAGYSGVYEHNLNSDPLFGDTAGVDYTVPDTSPCVNAGTPDTAGLALPRVDLADFPRISGDSIDIGAYEFQEAPPPPCTVFAGGGPGGSIAPAGSVEVAYGADQAFSITPDTGFAVAGIIVDGDTLAPDTVYSFIRVLANHTIKVFFAPFTAVERRMPVKVAPDFHCRALPGSGTWLVRFRLPNGEKVAFDLYDTQGRCRPVSIAKYLPAGTHHLEFSSAAWPTGIYCLRLKAGKHSWSKVMVNIRE